MAGSSGSREERAVLRQKGGFEEEGRRRCSELGRENGRWVSGCEQQ